MFDIGFWELCIVAIVALLVLGPERLPVAARTAGLWIAKARRMIGDVKSEIDRELKLDEVRKRLKEEETKLKESTGIDDLEGLASNTITDVKNFKNTVDTSQIVITDKAEEIPSSNQDAESDSDKPDNLSVKP